MVSKKENINQDVKEKFGRFLEKGTIIGIFENDSYLVRKEDGKISKKRHYDLKGICEDETTV